MQQKIKKSFSLYRKQFFPADNDSCIFSFFTTLFNGVFSI